MRNEDGSNKIRGVCIITYQFNFMKNEIKLNRNNTLPNVSLDSFLFPRMYTQVHP